MFKEIRPAQRKDCEKMLELLENICALHSDIRPDLFVKGKSKYTADSLSQLLSDETRPIYVAVDEADKALGYIFCAIHDYTDNSARCDYKELYIDDLCVDPDCRRQGIGDKLFNYAIDKAKSIGCYEVTLNVWEGNDSALRFYENHGMKLQRRTMEIVLD